MTCEESLNLLSERTDGELGAGEAVALDAHLDICATCRAMAEAMEVQDAALVRAFAPRRLAAAALAGRVAAEIARQDSPVVPPHAGPRPRRSLAWAGLGGAVAAGVVVAVVVLRHGTRPPGGALPPAAVQPVARMTLATGEVFTCPSDGQEWKPIAPGQSVAAGARVRTSPQSKCELRLSDGACVRLNAGTEAAITDRGNVRVTSGEVGSILPSDVPPLQITAGPACVTADGPGHDRPAPAESRGTRRTQLDLAVAPDAATVTVLSGSLEVTASAGLRATVHGGESLRVPAGCRAVTPALADDPLLAARWQDELLVLKPADDPEVAARVAQLLARISAERATAAATRPTLPGPVEEDVRARGEAWSGPLACYVCSRPAGASPVLAPIEQRRTAARLLSDLAPPWCVADLIELLRDEDGEVRYHAAAALRRLTGQDLGFPPGRCAVGGGAGDPAVAAWRAWWNENKGRYPASGGLHPQTK